MPLQLLHPFFVSHHDRILHLTKFLEGQVVVSGATDSTGRHFMYDLKTVQEVVGQRLVHAVHGMPEEAHEHDVDVLVELFHVGQGSSSLLQLPVHVSPSRTRCDVAQFYDAVFSPLGQGGNFEKVYLYRLGDIWGQTIFLAYFDKL